MIRQKCLLPIIVVIIAVQCYPSLWANQHFKFEGRIVFTIGQTKKSIENIHVFDGMSRKILQLTNEGINSSPKWSPDGKKIVFRSYLRHSHNNSEIYIMDADGKNQERLTYTKGGNSSDPRWDSTGNKIFFESAINGNVQEDVIDLRTIKQGTLGKTGGVPEVRPIKDINDYIKELHKKSERELEQSIEESERRKKELEQWFENRKTLFKYYPSPDGRYHILYYDFAKKLVTLDITTGIQKELKARKPGQPAWSKDSKKIAYVDGDMGDYFIIFDLEKNEYQKITLVKKPDFGCGGKLSWSRDSNYLIYSCGMPYSEEDESWLYILDLKTKKSIKLIEGNSPDWY